MDEFEVHRERGETSLTVEVMERRLSRDEVRKRLMVPRVSNSSVEMLKELGAEEPAEEGRFPNGLRNHLFGFSIHEGLGDEGSDVVETLGEEMGVTGELGVGGWTDKCGVIGVDSSETEAGIFSGSWPSSVVMGSSAPSSVTRTALRGSGKGANLIFLGVLGWESERRFDELAGVGFSSSELDALE